jgi:hypothetical protein
LCSEQPGDQLVTTLGSRVVGQSSREHEMAGNFIKQLEAAKAAKSAVRHRSPYRR